jgi:hypothetical protein
MLSSPFSKSLAILLLLVASVLTEAPAARGDVIMPGYRSVSHEFVLERSPETDRYSWLIWPSWVPNTAKEVIPGEPFTFYKLVSPTLYAVPRGTPIPAQLDREWLVTHGAHPVVGAKLAKVSTVRESDPTARVFTTIRLRPSDPLSADQREVRRAGDDQVLTQDATSLETAPAPPPETPAPEVLHAELHETRLDASGETVVRSWTRTAGLVAAGGILVLAVTLVLRRRRRPPVVSASEGSSP